MKPIDIWHNTDIRLIAILRGLRADEAGKVVEALLLAGIRAIEIPLNTPDAYKSIGIASEKARTAGKDSILIGAGTVLDEAQVDQVKLVGGNFIVSPNVNPEVIRKTRDLGMLSIPGVHTASECLGAINAGAHILKVFPASNLGPQGVKALRSVLPKSIDICAVGGIDIDDFPAFLEAGAGAFGIGASLYKPGLSADKIRVLAIKAVEAYRKAAT